MLYVRTHNTGIILSRNGLSISRNKSTGAYFVERSPMPELLINFIEAH